MLGVELTFFSFLFFDFHFLLFAAAIEHAMVCMNQIIDKLYLGGIAGTFDPSQLLDKGITHILSILEHPIPDDLLKDFKYKFVYALDLYDTDLLQELEECLTFIEDGIKEGVVLVHWWV
jgi:hypothetical protein